MIIILIWTPPAMKLSSYLWQMPFKVRVRTSKGHGFILLSFTYLQDYLSNKAELGYQK